MSACKIFRTIGFCLSLSFAATASPQTVQSEDVEMSTISGLSQQPRRHFRLRNARELSPQESLETYDIIRGALAKGYAKSKLPSAISYQSWRQFNAYPYRSATHGNHQLNNFANPQAQRYGAYENAGRLPPGAIVVKDSFAVSETGGILLGPLFIMEKMAQGFNYASGDWRYTLVGPDGVVVGQTKGPNTKAVEYCISCHIAAEAQDHLFFIPAEARRAPSD